jgi:hypothetical protein
LASDVQRIADGASIMRSLILLVALTSLATTPAVAQGLTKVRVAYDGFSMTSGPLIYADKQGIFKKFGLDIAPVFIDGGSMLTQAVVGGSVDIAQNGYTPALSAAVQGADVVIIGGISNKLPFQLVVKTSITRPDQLKGQSVAISRYGSSTDTAADFALAHLKLTRTDVKVLQLGGAATRIAAAMSGQIAGTMEQYPDTGGAFPARISRDGRCHRYCRRLSEHVLRDEPHFSQEPARGGEEISDGDGDGGARIQGESVGGRPALAEIPRREGPGEREGGV